MQVDGELAAALAEAGFTGQAVRELGAQELFELGQLFAANGAQDAWSSCESLAEAERPAVMVALDEDSAPASVPEAYLKLHLLSRRLVKPHGTNLDGIFAVLPNVASAQSYGTELPFVLGTSTRNAALGVTSIDFMPDAGIQYYNPSVMSSLQWKQFLFSRSTLFESSSQYHTLSYAHPLLNHGTIGVSILRVDVSGIEQRDQSNQLLSTDLHDSQTRILLGYGRSIGSSFAAGFNMVFDNHSFGEYNGSGVGFDVVSLWIRR